MIYFATLCPKHSSNVVPKKLISIDNVSLRHFICLLQGMKILPWNINATVSTLGNIHAVYPFALKIDCKSTCFFCLSITLVIF